MSAPISDSAETAALEADTDAAIEACGGDPRAAVRALLVANRYLENEVDRLSEAVSAFTRGRLRRPPTGADKSGDELGDDPSDDNNSERDRQGLAGLDEPRIAKRP
jgi:HAMP domain-containing protein